MCTCRGCNAVSMDPKLGYRELRPPAALSDSVACLWIRGTESGEVVRVVPDGCTDVVWQQGEGTTVSGPDTTAKLVDRRAGDLVIGMRLLPGAGGGVLGMPLDGLRDLSADVAEVDSAFDLSGDLAASEVVPRLLAAAEGRQPDPLVSVAVRMVVRQEVADVARELGLSERQLRRRFHSAAGYGPKTLARVMRFARFVEAIDGGETDLARLAFDAGYSDQAHLTRECTRMAGLAPAALLGARSR